MGGRRYNETHDYMVAGELAVHNFEDKVKDMMPRSRLLNMVGYKLYAIITNKVKEAKAEYYAAYVKHGDTY